MACPGNATTRLSGDWCKSIALWQTTERPTPHRRHSTTSCLAIPVGKPIVSANHSWLSSQMDRLEAARRWSQITNLQSAQDPLNQPQTIVLARSHCFDRGELENARLLVNSLLESAESGGQWRSVVELLVWQATILDAQGSRPSAVAAVARALDLAAPEGYVRTFVDGGEQVAQLLQEVAYSGSRSEQAIDVLAAFPRGEREHQQTLDRPPTHPAPASHLPESPDSLSDRELQVLSLIAEGLTNKEIAARLYLSPGTVKVHAHNIYSKLGVGGRTQAVARARSLSILP